MTLNTLAKTLFSTYDRYKRNHLNPGNCKHGVILPELQSIVGGCNGLMKMEELGLSIEGRSINMVTTGTGRKKVLLWSQMHGDESTATLALMDIFSFLVGVAHDAWVREMLGELTLVVIPMLNPDGAEIAERRTAAGIDMNRDALDLATPEARILRDAQRRLKPAFGFNLHDQDLSSAGNTDKVTAIALLAPALDEKKTKPPVRLRAMRVAAAVARTLGQFAPGHLATYDDAFEPRAFGDNMQKWGTSTVLIESGHWPGDPGKNFVRKLNYISILSALSVIANGSYQDVDLDYYDHLPPNTKRVYDVIIRGVKLSYRKRWTHPADIAFVFDPLLNKNSGQRLATVKDIGDLSTFGALQVIDGGSRTLDTDVLPVNKSLPFKDILDILQLPSA
jgi:hypothetical protein